MEKIVGDFVDFIDRASSPVVAPYDTQAFNEVR